MTVSLPARYQFRGNDVFHTGLDSFFSPYMKSALWIHSGFCLILKCDDTRKGANAFTRHMTYPELKTVLQTNKHTTQQCDADINITAGLGSRRNSLRFSKSRTGTVYCPQSPSMFAWMSRLCALCSAQLWLRNTHTHTHVHTSVKMMPWQCPVLSSAAQCSTY